MVVLVGQHLSAAFLSLLSEVADLEVNGVDVVIEERHYNEIQREIEGKRLDEFVRFRGRLARYVQELLTEDRYQWFRDDVDSDADGRIIMNAWVLRALWNIFKADGTIPHAV